VLSKTRIYYGASNHNQEDNLSRMPNPVAARCTALVCDRCLVGFVSSSPTGALICYSCECRVCCHLEVFAPGRSLVQKSPIVCGVSECDRPTSMRRPAKAAEPRKTFSIKSEECNIQFLVILSTLSTRSGELCILRCLLVA